MFPKIRSLALQLALSALFAGAFGAEFVLQNGVNDYSGCEDASLLSNAFYETLFDEHKKDEYSDEGVVWGALEDNYDHVPFLFANFCPS